jgi:Zn-dependent protease
MTDNTLVHLAIVIPLFIVSITLHELAHAATADALGDPTPREHGRLTFNPMAHLDPLGTLMLLISSMAGVGFGWAKPVPVKVNLLRWERFGNLLVSAAGPLSNILLAVLAIAALKYFPGMPHGSAVWLVTAASLNVVLAVLNLLPIPPLDGSHILEALLPQRLQPAYQEYARVGPIIFLALMLAPGAWNPLGWIFSRAVDLAFSTL